MTRSKSLILVLGMMILGMPVAHAQYTAKEWPEGSSKQRFADTCGDMMMVRVRLKLRACALARIRHGIRAPRLYSSATSADLMRV